MRRNLPKRGPWLGCAGNFITRTATQPHRAQFHRD